MTLSGISLYPVSASKGFDTNLGIGLKEFYHGDDWFFRHSTVKVG